MTSPEYQKAWREANKEKLRAYAKLYREVNKERLAHQKREYYLLNRAEFIAGASRRYKKNPDVAKARVADWVKKHPERRSKINSDYAKRNRDKTATNWRNRIARLRGNGGRHSAADIANLLRRQGGICTGCKADISKSFEVDHIMPLSKGGSNGPENLQLLCRSCNRRKGAKVLAA